MGSSPPPRGRILVTTAIPYVNGAPHIGHALELVQADVIARTLSAAGHAVRSQTGTDDNALKNVLSAEALAMPTADYVSVAADRFAALAGALDARFDVFLRTGSDPRHRAGVEALWRACVGSGDVYRKEYAGLYCIGCEAFYEPADLVDGTCPEHRTRPEHVTESNWFFRLSRYSDQLLDLILTGTLRITPDTRRNEVVEFIKNGLQDFSISRSANRARGWGIPVPDDPDQIVYVWFDALVNYITGSGYGDDEEAFARVWTTARRRIHVIGKGIIRFHAVYWPAMLLSAGLAAPTDIFVHQYLTADGQKIGKSAGNTISPVTLIEEHGLDALRWWLVREVSRTSDTDFTLDRLIARYNEDLANTIGNLVNRTVSMIHKYRGGRVGHLPEPDDLLTGLPEQLALDFDLKALAKLVVDQASLGNRTIDDAKPWKLAKSDDVEAAAELDNVLGTVLSMCRAVALALGPILPDASQRLWEQCTPDRDGVLPRPAPVFPRIEVS